MKTLNIMHLMAIGITLLVHLSNISIISANPTDDVDLAIAAVTEIKGEFTDADNISNLENQEINPDDDAITENHARYKRSTLIYLYTQPALIRFLC